ncbi:barnase inhibitor [Streptomyces ipomoeae]|uniref:Barnase inhibitor n=2 Tax=Streptomyces ipomoeae TaxID=103232 RepID=A0AAE8VY49_9ACTN|nr:barnase inhibitor [Streptomyces ipomoeae]TQE37851.1 barnase inhibitor [Streptomyces ipomoeae]
MSEMNEPLWWIRRWSAAEAPSPAAVDILGSRCRTTLDVFAEWSKALGFPGYFMHNWDSFEDCMFAVTRSAPLTVVIRDAAHLLADEPPRQLSTLLDILTGVTGRPANPPALLLLLDDTPDHLAALAERMTNA